MHCAKFIDFFQITTIEEHKNTEVVTMRNAYHAELGQLRKALDETAKERAKFQIDANKFEKEARELRARVKDREKAQEKAARDAQALQDRVNQLEAQLARAEDDVTELRPENNRLKNQLADAKKNLEEETLSRIDLQNQLITSQEGLKFENSLLEQQLNETKMRKQIEISELDGKLSDQYEEKLQQSLAVSY